MRLLAAAILSGFVILSATIAYVFRYDAAAMPGGGALVTDHWHGTVKFCTTFAGDSITVVCYDRYPDSLNR